MTREQAKENIANNSELYKWSLNYFDSELKKVRAENAKLQEEVKQLREERDEYHDRLVGLGITLRRKETCKIIPLRVKR